jgi:hypothetical protein
LYSSATVDDPVYQLLRLLVGDPSGQQCFQVLMINRWKIFDHIAVKGVAVLVDPGLALIQRSVSAFTHSAGIAVMNETRFPDRLNYLTQSMVYNAITKRSRADQPALGFVDVEVMILARPVGVRLQLFLQAQQTAFHVELKTGYRSPITLAARGQPVGLVQVLK